MRVWRLRAACMAFAGRGTGPGEHVSLRAYAAELPGRRGATGHRLAGSGAARVLSSPGVCRLGHGEARTSDARARTTARLWPAPSQGHEPCRAAMSRDPARAMSHDPARAMSRDPARAMSRGP